ncbi:hypothetical protein J4216_00955 [Candidatus Woesearchaeota archaeon]|nr:hypothetical protein [Candidatus Woesearchaeota archaeon]
MNKKVLLVLPLILIIFSTANAASLNCVLGDEQAYQDCIQEHGRCTRSESNGQILICWSDKPKPCNSTADCSEGKICMNNMCKNPQEEDQTEEDQERTEATTARETGTGKITLNAETTDDEEAEIVIELAEEPVDGVIIKKPKLSIDLTTKAISKIPEKIDAKLFPYSLYLMILLGISALILLILIIKDIIEPKMKF